MAGLARAVARLLTREGWLVGLFGLELVLLVGFWWSGPTPFTDAFDRRAAEADLVLLVLTSIPALVAGALLAAGDHEDGMAAFFRSCRVTTAQQIGGTALGLAAVTGGAIAVALPLSLLVAAPGSLAAPATWASLGLGLLSTVVHGAWGLAVGSWWRSRWAAVAGALGFWVLTVFALEALASALMAVVPPRWGLAVTLGFLALDPSEFFRTAVLFVRGQAWAFGPGFAPVQAWATTPGGQVSLVALALLHGAVPLGLAAAGWRRGTR